MTHIEAASPQFRAIVFKRSSPTSDFTCSERITLPGWHTAEGAWSAVRAAMRADDAVLGGEVALCPLSAH